MDSITARSAAGPVAASAAHDAATIAAAPAVETEVPAVAMTATKPDRGTTLDVGARPPQDGGNFLVLPSDPPQYVRLPQAPIRGGGPIMAEPPVHLKPRPVAPIIERPKADPAPPEPGAPFAPIHGRLDKTKLAVPLSKAQDNVMDALRANIDGYKLSVARLEQARRADSASQTSDHYQLEQAERQVEHLREVLLQQVVDGADLGLSGKLDATGDRITRFQALVDEVNQLHL